jgi:sugar phosphate permease
MFGGKRLSVSGKVLLLLCVMYFITYMDRVNVATAGGAFKTELGLSNTQLGLVFSMFAYPYLVFQIIGGWCADRFGARVVLTLCGIVWAGATIMTGLATGLFSLLMARLLLGIGEGATFPTATKAMARWLPENRMAFGQGITHASARIGNAATPPLVTALMAATSWRGAFILIGIVSMAWALVWGLYARDDPHLHPQVSAAERALLPQRPHAAKQLVPWFRLCRRMAPVTFVYFCYAWTLWTYLSWVPQFMLHAFGLNLKDSALLASLIFGAGVVGDALGGVVSDRILLLTGSLRRARRDQVVVGMAASMFCSIPLLFTHDATTATLLLASAFFFAEFTIAPMWAIPVDIAPEFAGTASGLMNTGTAIAAILSPLVFGAVIDATGRWSLPYAGTLALMGAGCIAAFWMHPEQRFSVMPPPVLEPHLA